MNYVSSADLYNLYEKEHVQYALPKKTVGMLVPKLFDKVSVVHQNGPSKYRGLRQRFDNPEVCTPDNVNEIAHKHGFVKLTEGDCHVKYMIYSGYTVNNQKQTKSVCINRDQTPTVCVGENHVLLNDLGLGGLKINTLEDAQILFNTVKQTRVCLGKVVHKDIKGTRKHILQYWTKSGDENQIEYRLSSRKCKGVVNFTAYGSTCSSCKNQSLCQEQPCNVQPFDTTNKLPVLKSLFPGCSELMLKLLTAQSNICNELEKDPRRRRWDKEVVQVCLTLWNRSPQAYSSLCSSGMLFLPSVNLLQRYKNCFEQSPGINTSMLLWMYNEAKRLNVDMRGGLIFDEMSIQDDLKMSFYGGKNTVDGLVSMGTLAEDIYALNSHKNELRLATHILQFLFLSYDGFRFPFSYFPTTGANVPELYITIWEAIAKLSTYEFSVDYVCFDGASNNRAFQLMHFDSKENAKSARFTAKNPYGDKQVTLMMDFSHNIKKLRNNINASGDHTVCTRKLCLGSKFIVWQHWVEAYNWDRSHNPMRVHQRLTNEHLFLTKTSKMRNHLAENVLDKEMLHLMKLYRASLPDGSYLEKSVELLEHTSAIIELFRDQRPIADLNDPRLGCLSKFEAWLDSWSHYVGTLTDISASDRSKMFISHETYCDLTSMVRGFLELCTRRIKVHKRSLVPAGLNSDVIENFFCQQRTICHGSNTNPTVHQYKYGINATILGQNAVCKKSNASTSKRKSVQPFNISRPGPLKRKCIRI